MTAAVLAWVIALLPVATDPLREEVRGLGELLELQRRLMDAELEVGKAMREEAALGDELRRARALFAERRAGLARARALLRRRLRALSRGRTRALVAVVLSSRDLSDFRKRRRALERAIATDLERLRSYRHEVRQVAALAAQIEAQRTRARALRAEVSRRRDEIAILKRRREGALAALRARGMDRRLSRSRAAGRLRLTRLVRSLRSQLRRATSVRRLRGRLLPPGEGVVIVPFGIVREPPFGTVSMHPGWRYRAEPGSRVVAVYAGKVVYARRLRGYGNVVIVDHGSRVHTLSARLGEIRVRQGQSIGAGATLGVVGADAGWLGPGFYFELRVEGRAVDPAPWFKSSSRESGRGSARRHGAGGAARAGSAERGGPT